MKRFATLLSILLIACSMSLGAEVALVGGTVHPVSAPDIEDGVLVIENGRIASVGKRGETAIPEGAKVVDVAGQDVWPGMIDAFDYLGLTEIGSVRGTRDLRESGRMNPNVRAEVAVNASSSHIPVTRQNGVLLALATPTGSFVSGTSALLALDGYTNEEMVRKAPVGLAVSWPRILPKPKKKDEAKEEEKKMPDWRDQVAALDTMLREAEAYRAAPKTVPRDVRWESLEGVLSGTVPLFVEAQNLAEIESALRFVAEHHLKMVLVDGGGYRAGEAPLVAKELAAAHVPVILKTNRMPAHRYSPYDDAFTAPARLRAAGVRIGFGSFGSWNARNLPTEAARAAAFGLDRKDAVAALTLETARILGVEKDYGSLEAGKSATIIVTKGHILDSAMTVARAFIDGKEVSLESRHTRLYEKWQNRPLPKDSRSPAR